jgi:hypothetical protein
VTGTATNSGLLMWEQSESGRVEHPFEPFVLAATLAMIPVLIVERDAKSDAWVTAALMANWIIWAVFAAELAFVLTVAPRKRAALRAHWLDVAIVVLTVPVSASLLASLRLLRLARLFRFVRAAVVIARALQAERRLTSGDTFRFVALATVFLVVMAGAVQSTVNESVFSEPLGRDLVGDSDGHDGRLRRPLPHHGHRSNHRDGTHVHRHRVSRRSHCDRLVTLRQE